MFDNIKLISSSDKIKQMIEKFVSTGQVESIGYCHISEKFAKLTRQNNELKLSVLHIKESVDASDMKISEHSIALMDAVKKQRIPLQENTQFDIHINSNDDMVFCLTVTKVITTKKQDRPNGLSIWTKKSLDFGTGHIESAKSPEMISEVYVGGLEQENELFFWKIKSDQHFRDVKWHPHSRAHLCLLTITKDQQKYLDITRDQKFQVYDIENSLVMPEIDVNLLIYRQGKVKQHNYVSFTFSTVQKQPQDSSYFSVFLLTSRGRIYCMNNFCLRNQYIPKVLFDDTFTKTALNQKAGKDHNQITQYSSSTIDTYLQKIPPLSKFSIKSNKKRDSDDYAAIIKVPYVSSHMFILFRKQKHDGNIAIEVIMTFSNIEDTFQKVDAFQVYQNQVNINDKSINTTNKLGLQIAQPRVIPSRMSFTNLSKLVAADVIEELQVETILFKDSIILIDSKQLFKFDQSQNPKDLNLQIKVIQVDQELQRFGESFGFLSPRSIILINEKSKPNVITTANFLYLLERQYTNFDMQMLEKVPIPRELTMKYDNLQSRCTSIKDRLKEKLNQFERNDPKDQANYAKVTDQIVEELTSILKNDINQVSVQMMQIAEKANFITELNQSQIEEVEQRSSQYKEKLARVNDNSSRICNKSIPFLLQKNIGVSVLQDIQNQTESELRILEAQLVDANENYQQQLDSFNWSINNKGLSDDQMKSLEENIIAKTAELKKLIQN